ncbi:MAG TPA: FtsX-like permease family protein [Phycisphaerae bacterium]|nr:FtsX-like permease family protein [Phycisphaerae bacterium]
MQHWLLLATRSWGTKPARSILAVLSVALGVGVIVWVTCCYESVRLKVTDVVLEWIGRSHVIVEPDLGVWAFFDQDIEGLVAKVPGVSYTTVQTREYVEAAPPPKGAADQAAPQFSRIEVTGVVPEKEQRFRTHKMAAGRFLLPDDKDAIVVEKLLADEFKLSVGDDILIRRHSESQPVRRFKIVGIADRRRASLNQAQMTWARLADVQSICGLPGKVKDVDIMVAEPTTKNIRDIAAAIRSAIDKRNEQREAAGLEPERIEVKTTETQHQKLDAAQGLLRFIMMLLSCAVLLTAFFIILATMSMGITEQITEIGLMRCVGVTRRQIAGLVLLQTAPLGIAGTLLGLPLGFALEGLTMKMAPDYVGAMAVSHWGVILAIVGGIGTTLLGAAVPAMSSLTVSPVDAARAQVGGRLLRWLWLMAILGGVLIGGHEMVKRSMSSEDMATFDARAIVSLILLYSGCAMIVPAVIMVFGRMAVHAAARLLALRPQLLGDEIAKAPYRSAAICCGLMVGLSLIVGLVVWGESVKAGWQFPKEFPDAMLYSYEPIPLEEFQAVRHTEGIAQFTVTDDFAFSLKKPPKSGILRSLSGLDQFSRFLAINPDEGFALVKLAYAEGNEQDAIAKLKQGGHILVTREFALANKKGLGDTVTIWVGSKKASFTIAGVVASPGLDIAISFFNATTYFQTYSVGAIIGTLADARRLFGRDYGKLMLFNFSFEQTDSSRITSDSGQTIVGSTGVTPEGRPTFEMGAGPLPGNGPEEQVVNQILAKLDYPPKAFVTARELKHQIDRNINRVMLLLSAIPMVGLIVAALGLANLMAANVASRTRQIAVLRAIGTTRGQLARIVIGEALVLGLIGSVVGLALGIALGRTSNFMTMLLSGFQPEFAVPWHMVAAGAALATLLCLLAALIPARYAARSNIVSVLSGL